MKMKYDSMDHPFFNKSRKEQRQIQLFVGIVGLFVIILSATISWILGIYVFWFLVTAITLSIVAPFFDIPAMKRRGALIYYSPLFLSEKLKKGVLKIHGGTLFDYVFVIDKRSSGAQRTRLILQCYVEGLLSLIDTYQGSGSNEIKVRGTSYIINKRTAGRLGFRVVQTDGLQKLILLYNYFNVLITLSLVKGKLSFPSMSSVISFESTIEGLSKRKAFLKELHYKLKDQSRLGLLEE